MNRRIYLIRHGHPDFPLGSRICLGQTDTPLGPLGRLQGVLLAQHLADVPLAAVYTSPLARARETARFLSADAIVVPGLAERATGLWDGLSFEEIARRWPEEYAARGDDPTLTMPGGEDLAAAGARFADAIAAILAETQGDIAIVAHKGVIETFLPRLGDGPGRSSLTAATGRWQKKGACWRWRPLRRCSRIRCSIRAAVGRCWQRSARRR